MTADGGSAQGGADTRRHAAMVLLPAQLPALSATVRALQTQTRSPRPPAPALQTRAPASGARAGPAASTSASTSGSRAQAAARGGSRSRRRAPGRLLLALVLTLAAAMAVGYYMGIELPLGAALLPVQAPHASGPEREHTPAASAPAPIQRAAPVPTPIR